MGRSRTFRRDNGLTLAFIGLFLVSLVGEAVAAYHQFNAEQVTHHQSTYGFGRYLLSSDFGAGVMENWQSEFLQFASFIFLGVWLSQRGSNESKSPEEPRRTSTREDKTGPDAESGSPAWARAGGWRTAVYGNSLLALMTFFFLASWSVQSITGWNRYNDQQQEHGQVTVSWVGYVTGADFWNRSLQNWQSEFLAVASISIFSVYLRQRGSPQSKPVGAPDTETGSSY